MPLPDPELDVAPTLSDLRSLRCHARLEHDSLPFGSHQANRTQITPLHEPGCHLRHSGPRKGSSGSLGGAATISFRSGPIFGPCVTAPSDGMLIYIAQTGDIALWASALFALRLG